MTPVVDEKKVQGKKKQKNKKKADPRKLEIFDACFALGGACNWVGDFDDAIRYFKRAKEGCEEQLGRESEKAFHATYSLIPCTVMRGGEKIEKYRDLLKRCERVLGVENVITLETLNQLGSNLDDNEEYEEAKGVWERYLAGRVKVLGENHKDTLGTLNNLGVIYELGKDHEETKKCSRNFKKFLYASGNSERFAQMITSCPGLAFEG
ncbi:hypothetical protein TrLO_g1292 [Triparma laevis f. longispina]|uniref:Uncharacterized protein n=1 Tax=Triparma laevis f. longispina TaxID=1714387 RepID=A0A9W7FCA5_9STRA|nr:hypothetical protein TrLO_g1292 [Triparma laevis f. longispina]